MTKYNVTGMSCAACSSKVEKAVSKVEGVTSCSVSLLTNSMGIEGSASEKEIIRAVEDAGYGASLADSVDSKKGSFSDENSLKDVETPKLLKRLFWSLGFCLILMYFSMGHMMWNWPIPAWFNNNHVAVGLVQMLLAAIIMIINQKFFINGFKGIIKSSTNMDTLVALGSGVSFLWSVFMLFKMTDAQLKGDALAVMQCMDSFYFESAGMILVLITVGKVLEAKSKGKTTNALKSLMKLSPKTATVIRNGEEEEVEINNVIAGDIFVVRPGSQIPVDGIVIEGESAVNESALTGESVPVDKETGSNVSAGTINQSGYLKCKATRVGNDTTLSQIIKMVSDAAATKAPIAKIADKVSGVFVPVVISIAIVTLIVWLLVGKTVGFALARGISVLVISCPCALGLATPVAIMVGNGVGAKRGILFKTSESLESAGKTQIVVLDKTGTITEGKPAVTEYEKVDEKLLQIALDIEKYSEHPLAKAVVAFAESEDLEAQAVEQFSIVGGKGVKAVIFDEGQPVQCFAGNLQFIKENCSLSVEEFDAIKARIEEAAVDGKTGLIFASTKKLFGIIYVADTIKQDSYIAVKCLGSLGVKVVMVTGDNEQTANAIAMEAGIDNVIAGVLPADKEDIVKELQKQGKVMMVGDGINDAPALTSADVGVAIGCGADVAVDAADVVLMNNNLTDVAAAIKLSRSTLKNIKENLFWAFIYNIIGIPLAAGVWIPLFGWELNPMFGAAAMSLSSFCVVTNALRLNLTKIYDFRKKKSLFGRKKSVIEELQLEEIKEKYNKENNKMTKTMKIEGMMCHHCEAHVKKALEAIDGVTEAVADHEKGTAVITLSKDVDNEVLTKAVVEADYKVLGIE